MTRLLMTLAVATGAGLPAAAAEKDTRVFELRTYYANAGKLDALHARFRDHTTKLFAKHGMTNLGYWVPAGANPDNKLVYLLAYPSDDARKTAWGAFLADPDWRAAVTASEKNGKIVAKIEQLMLTATDFSPAVAETKTDPPRTFELRTYTAAPGKLDALLARFRDHTVALFAKHGMTNLWYLTPAKGQPGEDVKLVYFLAHTSADARAKSFAAFGKDPDWTAALAASQKNGSLTAKDGVKFELLTPTDYSPIK